MKKFARYLLQFIILFITTAVFAQNQPGEVKQEKAPKVIQLSGLIVGGDSLYGIPDVSVYVPMTGRGAITSSVGYFSFPVLVGDSVRVKSMGFKDKNFSVPETPNDRMSIIIELSEDTLMFPAIEILPYPTERLFKEAFIALKLPEQDMNNMHSNLNEQVMKRMLYNMDHDGSMNHKYYMKQQVEKMENKNMLPTFNILSPFAWSKFIESLKKGEHKNKAKDYQYNDEDE